MFRQSLCYRYKVTRILYGSLGLFENTKDLKWGLNPLKERKKNAVSSSSNHNNDPRCEISGSSSNSAKSPRETPTRSWSIWGYSDRLADTNLHRSTPPRHFQSPFEKIRQRQSIASSSCATSSFPPPQKGKSATFRPSSPLVPPASRIHSGSTNSSNLGSTPTHLYANKENAWEHYTDDPYYGARRFKEYFARLVKDRAVRYYFLGILLLLAGAWAKLYQLEQEQRATEGLLGPKKKRYRSRLTVVLDVDETIVSFGDKAFRMKAGLVTRPYLAELLDYLSSIDAEVVLWSACSERYMRQVLNVIDPSGIRISQYITKSKLWFSSDNFYEKNLFWLKRDLKDVLFIENRALSVRNCNGNSILLDDFIRGEYMETGQDHPVNDQALRVVKEVVEALEKTGASVPEYLDDVEHRHPGIKDIPCHLAIRQLPEELARGVFFFIGNKFKAGG